MVYVAAGPLTAGAGEYDRLRARTILSALGSVGVTGFAPSRRDLALGIGADFKFEGIHLLSNDVPPGNRSSAAKFELRPNREAYAVVLDPADQIDFGPSFRQGFLSEDAALVVPTELNLSAARELTAKIAGPMLVLYVAGKTDPRDSDAVNGSVALAPYPAKGKYVGFAHLSGDGASATWTVEYKPVLHDFPEDERIVALKKEHQDAMRAARLVEKGATDARFLVGAAPPPNVRFVGAETCASCHAEAFKIWTASRHADAMTSLRKTGDDADPGCVRCHVVGYGTGRAFLGDEATSKFASVGCESCHGERGAHIAARRDLKVDERRPPDGERGCMVCHDAEHDPTFDFAARWPRIAHGAK